ncbi:DENN domain-containing protein [Colletotrichum sublineola]|uniref:Putative DENN domain-containing protein n=1 Tax=Colletotrichum sublineola TaxID=1173701 RepID=A0A066X9Z4_COLSU|nr:DENN domain-containing protein [Colletotrichum sublineola]KDN65993.1 putative DENN domain-containing protein [Colletotrichum sublineola]
MDSSSTPLADYFWIAGVESISYQDSTPQPPSNLESTIAEDSEYEENDADLNATPSKRVARHSSVGRHSRQNSGGRTSNGRFSINTLDEVDGNTRSNRSSATIRPSHASQINGSSGGNGLNIFNGLPAISGLDAEGQFIEGFDFDKALFKFAAERENFLEDLSFSAGARTQARPPMVNPRAERIKAEEGDMSGRRSPLRSIERSIKGSIRRKMSFRDMNSMRRQPTTPRASTPGAAGTIPRQGPSPSSVTQSSSPFRSTNSLAPASVRTAKRLSNYNSVIPPPEPLNTDPDMHPLKRRFEPVLLDRYPAKDATDEISRRGKFPDYVPMFAFPNDIQIVSSDERPRSTWHGFTMTSDDNSKIYGITIIIWTALTSEVADEVEQKCEQWRQGHMSNEERELAASLGVRLAAERAHLSQLLAKLPTIPSGSSARDVLDDQISTVEEKISLMTEMLRPLRHGAASKIDGLTAGESGLWAPRAYGILGRDQTRMTFWKEWLRAVVVPMTDGAVLRVPPSSPKVGRWQPLERYVVNLCTEAFSPLGSKTQVELGVRELRLYCRKEAINEIPGSRTIDIYALFRCLSIENVVALFEYAMSESRIIFMSSHTGMLHLACHALVSLLYPFKWASIFIPVLPARLISALEAPCPYIVGIERRYEKIELPDDDYVLVDLDMDTIDATAQPVRLPRQHRRKLISLLHVAAPHHIRYGVTTGPPPYAMESYPYDAFSVENDTLFNSSVTSSSLGKWVTQNSSSFGEPEPPNSVRPPIFNAFLHSKAGDHSKSDRPGTSKSGKTSPQSSVSPISMNFPPMPTTPVSRSDSGFAQTLREKKSGHFDEKSRRSSSFGMDKHPPLHRPSLPFLNGHNPSMSLSAVSIDSQSSYGGYTPGYAPSAYAQSTLAASTIMPNMLVQPVRNTDTMVWVEGHCFKWVPHDMSSTCSICDDKSEGDGIYQCSHCNGYAHNRCLGQVSVVCKEAFHSDRVRASFVRCLASLLYTYRKHLGRPTREQKSNGQLYSFDMNGYIKSLPYDQQEYATMLRDTQAFNEFIHERETQLATDSSIRLFDEIIMAKKARGRTGLSTGFSRLSTIRMSHGASSNASGFAAPSKLKIPTYLGDTSDHMWRTASVPVPSAKFPGEYHSVVTRIPSKLDPSLMKEPRAIQGVPRAEQRTRGLIRKQVPSMVGSPPKF